MTAIFVVIPRWATNDGDKSSVWLFRTRDAAEARYRAISAEALQPQEDGTSLLSVELFCTGLADEDELP